MKKHLIASLAVSAATVASLAVGLGTAPSASAGIADPAFQDNWPGQVEVDYRAPDNTVHSNLQMFLPPDKQPAPIGPQFSGPWAAAAGTLCQTLQTHVASTLTAKGYYLARWDSCSVQSTGDLQAAMVSPSQLELRWLVRGNQMAFDVGGAPTAPTLNATFDMEIDVLINAAGTIDGYDTNVSGTPLSLQSATLRFPYADFSTSNVAVLVGKPSILGQAAQGLTSTAIDLSTVPGGPNLSAILANGNAQLHTAASLISQNLVQSAMPGANEHFDFAMSVTSTNLVLTLARDGTPPAGTPTGCQWARGDGFTIQATCDSHQPAGVSQLGIEDGGPPWILHQESVDSFVNGAWNLRNAAGQPTLQADESGHITYAGWQVSAAVCNFNEWGDLCSPVTTFSDQIPNGGSYPVPPPPVFGNGQVGGGGGAHDNPCPYGPCKF